MSTLTSPQRKRLRSMAHHLDPAVMIGKQGLTDTVINAIDKSLEAHELIKIRFQEHKKEKKEITAQITQRTESHLAGIIGHIAILYRQHDDPEKRQIKLPD